ncbi:MAG: riboflavin synthase [Planctomycetota bacterium]|jgi:riboflavin synthase
MFTGIVEHVGVVTDLEPGPAGVRLRLDTRGWKNLPSPGDSVAVNGCCLTVVDGGPGATDPAGPDALRFDVVHQTLRTTTFGDLAAGDGVNLERAVTLSRPLDGHLVQGHIDGVGAVTRVDREQGEWLLRVVPPAELLEFIVEKGSIAVDGVSMTVARLGDSWFEMALIPTTIRMTTLGNAEPGRRVNLETDYVAKTIVHWLKRQR